VSRRVRLILAMLALLAIVDFCSQREQATTPSSYGTVPKGHGAVFELLSELELVRGRSLAAASRLEPGGTIWWIEPSQVCDARIASAGQVDILDPDAVRWPVASWIEAGGTAVVLLEPPGPGKVPCDAIAGVALPARVRLEGAGRIAGRVAPAGRELDDPRLHGFEAALDWQVAARADGSPFVLERVLGDGVLVVLADAGFVRNEALDRADSALLAVDLARAYGAPRIDEHEHGFAPELDAIGYLLQSSASPVFAGLALLFVLVAWRGNALPARSVSENDSKAPTLESFVASMAALYRRTGDHARVLERYRELCAARLRRHFRLPAGVSVDALAERIEATGRSADRLRSAATVSTASELRAAVRRLDELVEEVTR
jgi:hypothetical protein